MSLSMMPFGPEESYSRQLDRNVAAQEKPYGYSEPPPPADSGDYNADKMQSDKEYPERKRY